MIKLLSARTIAVLVASVASYLLLAASASGVLNAAEIKLLSGGAVKPVMSERNTVSAGIGDGASLTG